MRNKDEEIKQFLKMPPQGRTGYVKRQHSSLPEKLLLILKNRIRERKKVTPPQLLMVGINTQLSDNSASQATSWGLFPSSYVDASALKMGKTSLPKEKHGALGLTMRDHTFTVPTLPKSCPWQMLCPASQVTVMEASVLIDVPVEDTALLQLGKERVELSSQRTDKFKSPIKYRHLYDYTKNVLGQC